MLLELVIKNGKPKAEQVKRYIEARFDNAVKNPAINRPGYHKLKRAEKRPPIIKYKKAVSTTLFKNRGSLMPAEEEVSMNNGDARLGRTMSMIVHKRTARPVSMVIKGTEARDVVMNRSFAPL